MHGEPEREVVVRCDGPGRLGSGVILGFGFTKKERAMFRDFQGRLTAFGREFPVFVNPRYSLFFVQLISFPADPGYNATAACVVSAAMTIVEDGDKLPAGWANDSCNKYFFLQRRRLHDGRRVRQHEDLRATGQVRRDLRRGEKVKDGEKS